jgi:hypothetical protein
MKCRTQLKAVWPRLPGQSASTVRRGRCHGEGRARHEAVPARGHRPTLHHLETVARCCTSSRPSPSLLALLPRWRLAPRRASPSSPPRPPPSPSPSAHHRLRHLRLPNPHCSQARSSFSPPLDFTTHHTAEAEAETALARRVYESCPAKYFEYTLCEDAERSLHFPRDLLMYRERHCLADGARLWCLVPGPSG